MKYVGATNWFIRWPFLLEGLFLGFIGGVIADIASISSTILPSRRFTSPWLSCRWSVSIPLCTARQASS